MFSTLLIMLVGWPGILTALGLSFAGIIRKQPALLLAGALLAIPFAWYLNGIPRFTGAGLFLPLFQVGAAMLIARGRRWLAALCLLPFISITTWLAAIVLSQ